MISSLTNASPSSWSDGPTDLDNHGRGAVIGGARSGGEDDERGQGEGFEGMHGHARLASEHATGALHSCAIGSVPHMQQAQP